MTTAQPSTNAAAHQVVGEQVAALLSQSQAFRELPPQKQAEIQRNTEEVAAFLAEHDPNNPIARALGNEDPLLPQRRQLGPQRGEGDDSQFNALAMSQGVEAIRRLIDEVDFPTFVAELIRGTFQAIVDASLQQMQAYAELVKSVATSLSEFRDQEVSPGQGREHLMQKYPGLFQMGNEDGRSVLTVSRDADTFNLPNFQSDFGLAESIDDLDTEVIEGTLVPAARTSIARDRQRLLATMVMMGINRIIVTDGEINARVRFNFSASDQIRSQSMTADYKTMGVASKSTGTYESDYEGSRYERDNEGRVEYRGAKRYTTGAHKYEERPVIKLSSMKTTQTEGQIQAAGQMLGSVKIKFRSETFPLERMLETDQLTRLQSAGRGAPARAGGPPAAPAGPGTGQGTPPNTTP
ncbi:hypothetical protein [Haliangium sp.]|uniref:hypothetical protein n=1 Tax=Haliangium sp. TaxID=2663208 RepID=UPI003D122989